MFSFIGGWSAAAIVLSDLASTAHHLGGIGESQLGEVAPWFVLVVPWFVLLVMLVSHAVRSFSVESYLTFTPSGVH